MLPGNACGPPIWVALSFIGFEILHKRGLGVEFTSALFKKICVLVGFAYVEDCDLIQAG